MSTTLPHGIIQINEGNISWYGDITANWQLIDSKIGEYDAAVASIPAPANTGTLTINYGGTTIAMFGADDAGNVTADIPAPGDGTLTIQQNGTTVDTFTANSSSGKTVNIQCVDLTNNQTVGGVKKFSDGLFASKSGQGDLATLEDSSINSTNEDANGMPLTGHTNSLKIKGSQANVIPCVLTGQVFTSGNTSASLRVYKYKDINKRADIQITYIYATDRAEVQFNNCHITTNASGVYDIGSSSRQFGTAYIKALSINGTAAGDILTHNASEFVDVSSDQTVGGVKTFTSLVSKSNTLERGSLPTTNINEDPIFISVDKNNRRTLAFFNYYNTNGDGRVVLYAYNQNTTNFDNVGLVFGFDNTNNSKSIYPVITNAYNLGTSTNKWKDVNTVLLNGKTPAYSTDIPTKVSQLTNDSGFITSENALPTGSYIQFAGSQAPAGFLVCNGGAISRTTYSALFAVIGTTYGSGDGSTTFNLPNLTDRFLQGSTTSGTVKNAGLPNIVGFFNYNCTGTTGNVSSAEAISCSSGVVNATVGGGGDISLYINDLTFNASNSNSIYNNSATVQPPALTCLICIKY